MKPERRYDLAQKYPTLLFCEKESEKTFFSDFDIPKPIIDYFDFTKFIKENVVHVGFLVRYKDYINFKELVKYICTRDVFLEVYNKIPCGFLAGVSSEVPLKVFETAIDKTPEHFTEEFFESFCYYRNDLTEDFIKKYFDKIDLSLLSKSIANLSKSFIIDHIEKFDINSVFEFSKDESLIQEVFHSFVSSTTENVNENILSMLRNELVLSTEFVDEVFERLDEFRLHFDECIFSHNLPSEQFLERHIHEYNVDTKNTLIQYYELYGKLSRDFIKRNLRHFIGTDLMLYVEFDEDFIMTVLRHNFSDEDIYANQRLPIEFVCSELKSGDLKESVVIAILNSYNIPSDVIKECKFASKFNGWIVNKKVQRWCYLTQEKKQELIDDKIKYGYKVKDNKIYGYLSDVETFVNFHANEMKEGKLYCVKSSCCGNMGFEISNTDPCRYFQKEHNLISVLLNDITFLDFHSPLIYTDKIILEKL